MILVDTSVWVTHLRTTRTDVAGLLDAGEVLGHAWVVGELAMGNLRDRAAVLQLLRQLPQAELATADEVLTLVEREQLHGLGIGFVDAQLLAATRLTPGALLWTDDRRLLAAASRLGVAHGNP